MRQLVCTMISVRGMRRQWRPHVAVVIATVWPARRRCRRTHVQNATDNMIQHYCFFFLISMVWTIWIECDDESKQVFGRWKFSHCPTDLNWRICGVGRHLVEDKVKLLKLSIFSITALSPLSWFYCSNVSSDSTYFSRFQLFCDVFYTYLLIHFKI